MMNNETAAPVLLTEAKVKKIARWEDSFRKIAGKAAADGPVAAKSYMNCSLKICWRYWKN